ncbi:hypothetical protein CSKR_107907 [Clonorchis sinensis]|uniref:Uncharacterized protein n=1 Tax=Clonorchis sinensis TaxID=79923 RepID=A0A419PN31_CLOSI|nr:hypothetical protein CSKR_107907 [Clonorchis sinensis]
MSVSRDRASDQPAGFGGSVFIGYFWLYELSIAKRGVGVLCRLQKCSEKQRRTSTWSESTQAFRKELQAVTGLHQWQLMAIWSSWSLDGAVWSITQSTISTVLETGSATEYSVFDTYRYLACSDVCASRVEPKTTNVGRNSTQIVPYRSQLGAATVEKPIPHKIGQNRVILQSSIKGNSDWSKVQTQQPIRPRIGRNPVANASSIRRQEFQNVLAACTLYTTSCKVFLT